MKMRNLIALMAMALFCFSSIAQSTVKIGYADIDYILSEMPETKQIESDLKVHESQLQNQYQAKVQDYQAKLEQYQQGASAMTDLIRTDKERELTQLQQNIQLFQQDAQLDLQKKTAELFQPIYKKMEEAINTVANENGYTFILSARIGSIDVVLYANEENDVSDLVLKKMGITLQNSN